MSRFCSCLLMVCALAAVTPGISRAAPPDQTKTPAIDVVLCLDVSDSMQGLINSAKAKLWDIVNDLGKSKPTPNLRVALYSYGHSNYDAKKGWVRKEIDLTTDLDAVYKQLTALTLSGGDEYVARVTHDALNEQKWSTERKALKMIFVCGNEPATQDPTLKLEEVAKLAVKKDVIVNTILCGRGHGGDTEWQQFAVRAEGTFITIDQNAGAVVMATPFDKTLAELSTKLNTTYVAYGRKEMRDDRVQLQALQDSNAAKVAPGVAATRAASKASALYRNSQWDLCDRLKEDPKLDITKIPEDQLCDELKKLKPEARVAYVKDQLAKREAIQKEIAGLSVKRQQFIEAEQKKAAKPAAAAFDEAVRETLRKQADRKGIVIPK